MADFDQNGQGSFADIMYQKIDSVLGGENKNQFLCLTIPGQALLAEDFKYDYKNNKPKGPVVEANESRLVNKLFDPCRMTGADNGLTLPYQYRTALDMLTPMLNAKAADAKNKLRQLLMTKYNYHFEEDGDGVKKEYTLQEVFFKLYDEWVAAKKKWADDQAEEKRILADQYLDGSAQGNTRFNDKYLEWYEDNAEGRISELNEKMAKVIAVFTPNDMDILEGVLDSGSGAELQQARQALRNTQKLTPDGGYVYPVKLNPTNWFELLETSFTADDLLKDPDVLAVQMELLTARKLQLSESIVSITEQVPKEGQIDELVKKKNACFSELENAKTALADCYGEAMKEGINILMDIMPAFAASGAMVPAEIIAKISGGAKPAEDAEKTKQAMQEASKKQDEYLNALQALTDAAADEIKARNLSLLQEMLAPLNTQLKEVKNQIKDLQAQILLSSAMRPDPQEDGTIRDEDASESGVAPMDVPQGYTQVVLTASVSQMDQSSASETHSSARTSGVHFLFGGFTSSETDASSSVSHFLGNSDAQVLIGMNVAKVGIEREWFNPGVFYLTKDMFNVTTHRISPNPAVPYTSMSDRRLRDMADGMVFPCYPTAFIVARDISVKIVSEAGFSSDFTNTVDQHASAGGSFLFFSGSVSKDYSASTSGVSSSSTSNSVTLKFSSPQVIGYYLEATAPDQSSYLDDVSKTQQAGYVTVSEFVEKYKQILEEYNQGRANRR